MNSFMFMLCPYRRLYSFMFMDCRGAILCARPINVRTIRQKHVKIRLNHQIVCNLHAHGIAMPYLCKQKCLLALCSTTHPRAAYAAQTPSHMRALAGHSECSEISDKLATCMLRLHAATS